MMRKRASSEVGKILQRIYTELFIYLTPKEGASATKRKETCKRIFIEEYQRSMYIKKTKQNTTKTEQCQTKLEPNVNIRTTN